MLANIITRFGDGIDTLAFALLVYEITGSKALWQLRLELVEFLIWFLE
ncbi:hypothetical protein [Clostridium neonatale]|uniref:Uncharacterized protein n=1 Tax=Clostridium neonatale TaxID=137838 RepID=A0AA86K0K6_9CLOT|nr:hypothetical protein CNEO_50015 [Clostridium neonatale]